MQLSALQCFTPKRFPCAPSGVCEIGQDWSGLATRSCVLEARVLPYYLQYNLAALKANFVVQYGDSTLVAHQPCKRQIRALRPVLETFCSLAKLWEVTRAWGLKAMGSSGITLVIKHVL